MRVIKGALAVAVAALLVSCNADPHQGEDAAEHTGHKTRNLDPLGGGNLVRHVRESRHPGWVPYMVARRFDYGSPYSGKRELWPLVSPLEFGGYFGDGLPKRNFDEIDRSGLDNFVKKRNFDEIDQTSMPFPFSKRFGPNYFGYGVSSLSDRQMDDLAQFPIGSKHSSDISSLGDKRYQMDEMNLSQFPVGSKRSSADYTLAKFL